MFLILDENNQQLCSFLMNLPSKRKSPDYYQQINDPIDLATIEQNITSGVYKVAEKFDLDMGRVLNNAIKYYGRTSEKGIAATRLKKAFCEVKLKNLSKLESKLGVKPSITFLSKRNKSKSDLNMGKKVKTDS